ncbi:MAG: ECF transporter S component [Clostridia bacterium]|nr:ECF transporter S component [Clostridia bacterium]
MNKNLKKLTYSAVLLALAFLLPFITANNMELGNAFCLMHIPVLLCGLICGPVWGTAMGAVAPLLRSAVIGAPPFPTVALPMAFELGAYALAAGLMYKLLPKRMPYVYLSLCAAMVFGRIVHGTVKFLLYGFKGGFSGYITGTVLVSWPGVLVQLLLIPLIFIALKRAKLLPENNKI